MGYYIQGPNKDKAGFLLKNHDAMLLESAVQAREAFKEGFGVVCVVDNGIFKAAAFAFSEEELEVFAKPDGRPKTWLAMDRKLAEELSGYGK
jgi:hypothetical protein